MNGGPGIERRWLALILPCTVLCMAAAGGVMRRSIAAESTPDLIFVTDDRALAPPVPTWWHHGGCDSVSVVDGNDGREVFRPIGQVSPGQITASSDGSLAVALSTNGDSFLQVLTREAAAPNRWSSVIAFEPAPPGPMHEWQIGGPVVITEDDQSLLVATRNGFKVYATDSLRRGMLGTPTREFSSPRIIDPAAFEVASDGTTLFVIGADRLVHVVDVRSLLEMGPPIPYSPVDGIPSHRIRRTFATLSPDNRYLVINGGTNNNGINVVDLVRRTSIVVQVPTMSVTWGVRFDWAAGYENLLAVHGGSEVAVVRFRGAETPDLLARQVIPPVTDAELRVLGQSELWRPGGVAWSMSGARLHASIGSSKIGKEWRSFAFDSSVGVLRERFDFDSCTWTGQDPPQDERSIQGKQGLPLDIITLNGRNRPTLTPTPAPTPSDTPTPTPPPTATTTHPSTATPSPRPTSTITPTPSSTPTRPPPLIYLPLALREHCAPGVAPVDAVLVVDASVSMAGAKLDAAKAAAHAFIDALSPASDRVGLVAFSETAALLQPLTGVPAALLAAVDGIAPSPGTRIDRGLDAALGELRAARRGAPAVAVVILLTDGIQSVEADRPAGLADGARADRIDLWVVGLGGDVDAAYLRRVAGGADGAHADRYMAAASVDDLVGIYRDIARLVPCPVERFWGRR